MRRLLATLMALLCLAAPALAQCDSCSQSFNGGTFKATFPGKCSAQQLKPGITKYYYHDKAENQIYGVAVFSGKEHRHLGDLRQYLVKRGITQLTDVTKRQVHRGSTPGVEYSGIDSNGSPMTVRLYVTKTNSYVVAASGFDMAKNRQFVESFQLASK